MSILSIVGSYHLIRWTNQNAGFLSLLFSAVVAVATVFYAVLTRRLVSETIQLRHIETDPDIFVELQPHPTSIFMLEFVVSNVGRGKALGVSFRFDPPLDSESRLHLSEVEFLKQKRDIPPNHQHRFYFGYGPELLNEPPLPPIGVLIQYQSVAGEEFQKRFCVSVNDLLGLLQYGSQPEEVISKVIGKLADAIEAVTTSKKRLRVEVTTTHEATREIEEEVRHFKEMQALRRIEQRKQSEAQVRETPESE